MRNLLLTILSLLLVLPCSAKAKSDSLAVESNFKAGEFIVPLSLVGVGSLGFVEPIKTWHHGLQGNLSKREGESVIKADEYLRFAPMVGIYGASLLGAEAKHGYMDRTLELGVSFVALTTIGYGCKYMIHSPRPNGVDNNSFPSGHTLASFEAATSIFLYYKKWGIAPLSFATLIGISRIFLLVHYPSDVLAGALFGILFAVGASFVAKNLYFILKQKFVNF